MTELGDLQKIKEKAEELEQMCIHSDVDIEHDTLARDGKLTRRGMELRRALRNIVSVSAAQKAISILRDVQK